MEQFKQLKLIWKLRPSNNSDSQIILHQFTLFMEWMEKLVSDLKKDLIIIGYPLFIMSCLRILLFGNCEESLLLFSVYKHLFERNHKKEIHQFEAFFSVVEYRNLLLYLKNELIYCWINYIYHVYISSKSRDILFWYFSNSNLNALLEIINKRINIHTDRLNDRNCILGFTEHEVIESNDIIKSTSYSFIKSIPKVPPIYWWGNIVDVSFIHTPWDIESIPKALIGSKLFYFIFFVCCFTLKGFHQRRKIFKNKKWIRG